MNTNTNINAADGPWAIKVESTGKVKVGKRWVPAERGEDGSVWRVLANGEAVDATEKQAATYFKTGDPFGTPL